LNSKIAEFLGDVVESFLCQFPSSKILIHDCERSSEEICGGTQDLRDLAQKEPETYLGFVATTLSGSVFLENTQNQFDKSRKEVSEALQIYRDLAQEDPQTYLPHIAMTLNNSFAKEDPDQFLSLAEQVKMPLKPLSPRAFR
jgi:hypothetical protein